MTLKKSWLESVNLAPSFFPLNNLPHGVFSTSASTHATHKEG